MLDVSRLIKMLVVLAIVATPMLVSTIVSACINPLDDAIEILFNKPGVGYNLIALLESFRNVITVEEDRLYAFKYVYVTGGRGYELAVYIYIERFCSGAPCIEGFNDEPPVTNVLGLRIEPLKTSPQPSVTTTPATEMTPPPQTLTTATTTVVYHIDVITVVNDTTKVVPVYETTTVVIPVSPQVVPQTLATQAMREYANIVYEAFLDLLNALAKSGVITGLSGDDIIDIMVAVKVYYFTPYGVNLVSGWNNRLMYSEALGGWAPYSVLVRDGLVKGLVVKGNKCSYTVPQHILDELEKTEASLMVIESVYTPPPLGHTETIVIATPSMITWFSTSQREPTTITPATTSLPIPSPTPGSPKIATEPTYTYTLPSHIETVATQAAPITSPTVAPQAIITVTVPTTVTVVTVGAATVQARDLVDPKVVTAMVVGVVASVTVYILAKKIWQ
ncbi:MAG: hypothetical protein QXF10_09305 [Ignisphaera sp.]